MRKGKKLVELIVFRRWLELMYKEKRRFEVNFKVFDLMNDISIYLIIGFKKDRGGVDWSK